MSQILDPSWLEGIAEGGPTVALIVCIAMFIWAFNRNQDRESSSHAAYAKRLEQIGQSCHVHQIELAQRHKETIETLVKSHQETISQMDRRWVAESGAIIEVAKSMKMSIDRLREDMEKRR